MRPTVINTESLPEFFIGEIKRSLKHVRVHVSSDVEFYLVNLLTHFAKTEKLFEIDANGEPVDRALAIQWLESFLASPGQRVCMLKHIGDLSLYTSGFFADSFFKKLVSVDYTIQMGHTAYSSLPGLMPGENGKSLRDLFEELAGNFVRLVEVIEDVADHAHLNTNPNLLKLYERWLATGSERIKNLLNSQGIIPNELVKIGGIH